MFANIPFSKEHFCVGSFFLCSTMLVADGAQGSTLVEPFDWSLVWNRQVFTTVALGAVSGYVASKVLGGEGFGFFGNIVVGIIGGLIGKWVTETANIPMLGGFFGTLVSSVGGALILILFIEIIKYLQRANGSKARATRSTSKKQR
jgi:uncharacterized membrane protein YeaQ/YmgE (transglycosylase-associated protein family)